MLKILFTGGGGAGNEAIIRLLDMRYETHFADANLAAISPDIPAARRHLIPMATEPNFAQAIQDLCARLKIDLIVPGVDEELYEMSCIEELCAMLPQSTYVRTMLDKLKSARAFEAVGLDFPRTETIADAMTMHWDLFPCIAKPRSGRGSRNVHLLGSMNQVASYLDLTSLEARDAVLQEQLIGQEYTVLIAANQDARIHAIVPVRVEAKRGITLCAETENNPIVISACRAIHNALPARGCYNIQLMLTRDSHVVPFEINPRISTTFCLGIAAGIDPVAVYFSNDEPHNLLSFRDGLKLRRYWTNHFEMMEERE